MKIRTIFLLFVLILMAVFLVINWTALSTVTAVNLIYTEIQAPLGVLVVGGFAAVVLDVYKRQIVRRGVERRGRVAARDFSARFCLQMIWIWVNPNL